MPSSPLNKWLRWIGVATGSMSASEDRANVPHFRSGLGRRTAGPSRRRGNGGFVQRAAGLRWFAFGMLTASCGLLGGEPEKKPERIEVADPNPPAFKIMSGGSCPSDYAPRGRSCVHVRATRELGEQRLARELLAYEQGAAPPRLGPQGVMAPEPPALAEDKDPSKLAPDALSTGQVIDPKEAEQKRLQELQRMIDATRARSGTPTPPPSTASTTQAVPANMDGLNVEVEMDGKKRSMSASEWVNQQRANK